MEARAEGARRRRLLVVDDDVYTHDLFRALFDDPEFDVQSSRDGLDGLTRCRTERFDVVLTDVRMPRLDGIGFLRELRVTDPDTPVVVMTAYGSVETAVEAMKLGAYDYLTKPFEKPQAVRHLVQRVLAHHDLVEENRALKARLEGVEPDQAVIGTSPAMQAVFRLVEKVAPIDSTVLVQGESGTGKELIARTLHRLSPRRAGRFLPVNCGALPETLLESTLFGYEKGAFTGALKTTPGTFEAAHGGTLFLDEVESMSPNLQVRLLRVLQERSFFRVGGTDPIETDVRIVGATKGDLKEEVRGGRFRDDLYYRLNVLTVTLPPLRERSGDLPALVQLFVGRYARKFGKDVRGVNDEVLDALRGYAWPGNVRELENVIERAVALAERPRLTVADLPPEVAPRRSVPLDAGELAPEPAADYQAAKSRFEKAYLQELLVRAGGNVSEAARLSGIQRQNLYLKLQRYELDPEGYRPA
jgi:DNA-binding NtrC family response regulator